MTPEPILSVRNLSKTFPGQRALREVSMEVLPGEVHALVGQNGSGKSTLIKCLSGYQQPDAGAEIIVAGARLRHGHSDRDARAAGMCFVHQDLGIVPTLSVLENFCLGPGFETGLLYSIRFKAEAQRIGRLLADFGHDISPWTLAGRLPAADRTIVAIVRALGGAEEAGGRLLVLDEPTAALPAAEVDRLFSAMRRIARRGVGMIYVSHRLQEIFEVADRVTVLRDGARVGTFSVADLTMRQLVELIVGRTIESYYPDIEAGSREGTLLEVEGLCGNRVSEASFEVRRGEIVGVAGLLGSGCSELGRLVFGAEQRRAGTIRFKGKEVSYRSPGRAMKDGMAMITEDRRRDGCLPTHTVGENMVITDLERFWRFGWLSTRAEKQEVCALVKEFGVTPPDPGRSFSTLSGGNQQKAILAKWMRLKPDLLICDEPVVGIDIGSKTDIYGLIERSAADGAGVLLISSESKDLAKLCHKVLVVQNGCIVATLAGGDLTEERIASSILYVVEGACA